MAVLFAGVSPDDPRLAIYRSLKATNATRDANLFVVEGEKLLDRLLASRFPVVSVLASDRIAHGLADRLPTAVPLFVMPEADVSRLVGFTFHRGVLACGLRLPWPALDELAGTFPGEATVVVCPRIDNPENLGAIVRNADVFDAAAVIVGGRAPDPLSRRVLRVSMGTALRTPVLTPSDLLAEVGRLRERHGFELVAATMGPPAAPLDTFVRARRTALFLGCEGDGLAREWLDACDRLVTIPMRAGAESLNVAVAAGLLLYHLARPRPGPIEGSTEVPPREPPT